MTRSGGGGGFTFELKTLNQDPLGTDPGSINYDAEKSVMNIKNSFNNSSLQVGQESVVFVVNNTGSTITDGKVVRIGGYDAIADALEIELTISDDTDNAKILGLTTTSMLDGEKGLVTIFGRVNKLDTSMYAEGALLYLSDTVLGELTDVRPAIPIQIGHVGAVDGSVGFIHVHIRELEKSIYGGFSSLETQTFTADTPTPITFNNNDEFSGIAHSETVNNSEFTFLSSGVYQVTIEPQVLRNVGGSGTDNLSVWAQTDTGGGFANVANSNTKTTISGSQSTGISPLTNTFRVAKNDKVRFMVSVDDASLELRFSAVDGAIPATPSAILNLVRIGD